MHPSVSHDSHDSISEHDSHFFVIGSKIVFCGQFMDCLALSCLYYGVSASNLVFDTQVSSSEDEFLHKHFPSTHIPLLLQEYAHCLLISHIL